MYRERMVGLVPPQSAAPCARDGELRKRFHGGVKVQHVTPQHAQRRECCKPPTVDFRTGAYTHGDLRYCDDACCRIQPGDTGYFGAKRLPTEHAINRHQIDYWREQVTH